MTNFYKRIVFENTSIFFISLSLLLMISIIIHQQIYLIDIYFIIETTILITVFRRFTLLILTNPSKSQANILLFSILLILNFGFAAFHQISIHLRSFFKFRLYFELSYRIFILIISTSLLIIGIILVNQANNHIKQTRLLDMNAYVYLTPDAHSKISTLKKPQSHNTNKSKKTNNGITEIYFGKRQLQIIILCVVIMICSLGEVILCIIKNFIMDPKNFDRDGKNMTSKSFIGFIVNSLIMFMCLLSSCAFYISFYWVVKDNFVEYYNEIDDSEETDGSINEITNEENKTKRKVSVANTNQRVLSFSEEDINVYGSLRENKEIGGFLEKSRIEEDVHKKKKQRKNTGVDSFSTLEIHNNNKSCDIIDVNIKKETNMIDSNSNTNCETNNENIEERHDIILEK